MEQLFNAEVIRAAASSNLGVLSLMCLLLGAVAMAFFKQSESYIRIIVFVILFAGVAGFGYAMMNQAGKDHPEEVKHSERIDNEFVVGRWAVQQKAGTLEGASYIDYSADGSFSGNWEVFDEAGNGQRIALHGQWELEKKQNDEFEMILSFDDGRQHTMLFRVLDQDHVHNLNENYVSVRIPR